MGANLATPLDRDETQPKRQDVKVHIGDEYSEGMSYGGSTTAYYEEGTTTLGYTQHHQGEYHRRRHRDSFSGESPDNTYYYNYEERRGERSARDHRHAESTREKSVSVRPYGATSTRSPRVAGNNPRGPVTHAVHGMDSNDEPDLASMIACLDDERDALMKQLQKTQSHGTFSTLTCTVNPACQNRSDLYEAEVAVNGNIQVQKKLEELLKQQQVQEKKLEQQLEQLRIQKERLQQIQAEKMTNFIHVESELRSVKGQPTNDKGHARVGPEQVASQQKNFEDEALLRPLKSIEEHPELVDGKRTVGKSAPNETLKALEATGNIINEGGSSANPQQQLRGERHVPVRERDEDEREPSPEEEEDNSKEDVNIQHLGDFVTDTKQSQRDNDPASTGSPAGSGDHILMKRSSLSQDGDIPEQVSSIDDEIDMKFVAQYDKAFNVFLASNPDLFEKSSELIQNLKVAKLQKILQVTYQIECDLENHVEASEELKAKTDAEFQYKLKEASRRKAARAIQLQSDLSSMKKQLKQTEASLTWEMVTTGVNRATKLKHLKRDLKQATGGSNRNDLIALLPDSPGYKEIKTAALASSEDGITEEERWKLQKLQVDNAFLHADVKTLERTVAFQKVEAKKQAWVDAVLLQLDAKKMKNLRVRYQKKIGISF